MARETSLAILNGFGISLGDSVIGLQALRAAQLLGAATPKPVLFRKPGLRRMVDKIYPHAADFSSVRALPEDLLAEDLMREGFGRVIDIRDFAFDPRFRGVAMVDFFLDRLGLDPTTVPAGLKRNAWLAPVVDAVPPPLAETYILVCPVSSMSLRDMPQAAHERILLRLMASGKRVVTQGRVPEALEGRVAQMPSCASVAELCGWVGRAAAIVSTDTAMVHLADAFSVRCLAFFTTHRPEWRVRDYPLCTPVHLPARGLPEALEFLRGPQDLAATQDAWTADGADMAWLDDVLERFL